MRLLHITNTLSEGGVESLLLQLLSRFVDQGHMVDLLVLNPKSLQMKSAFEQHGILVITGCHRSIYNPLNTCKIGSTVIANRYDIVHTHLFPTQYWGAIARSIWGSRCKCWITSEHGSHNRRRGKAILRPLERWVYKRYNTTVGVSNEASMALKGWLDTPNHNSIITITNGIDLQLYEQVKPYSNQELDLPENCRKIVMVARFFAAKDHATAIRAMTHLPADTYLLLVGSGDYTTFKALSDSLNLNDRVRFMGGRNDVPRLLRSCDVAILATHGEGLSIFMIEAMASGLPMVASRVDGVTELLDGYGLLYDPQDSDDLARKVKKIVDNKEFYDYLSGKSQERANQFDIKNTAEQYVKLYNQCNKN